MDLPQVEAFSNSLKSCMQEILNNISPSFVKAAPITHLLSLLLVEELNYQWLKCLLVEQLRLTEKRLT